MRDAKWNLLLVRKRGASAFMQPGGKIEICELPVNAMVRELREELGVVIAGDAPTHIGRFTAPVANEPGSMVEGEVFELTQPGEPVAMAEIEKMLWLIPDHAGDSELATLTRDAMMPRYRRSSEASDNEHCHRQISILPWHGRLI
ncbi:NUDIX hydrolase [Mesorhizobium sp. L-8-3]|uniref:NUDIX hydrolase n=1 Tax=Mesorhizobium sp. L-8-3 TaxID=2744522 RepID=UPI00237A11E4|nr:NUDIX domain-containing protein [Mesorhizobium sp. L-8-3]